MNSLDQIIFLLNDGINFLSFIRPDWGRCAKYVEGGSERWKEISKDKNSNDLIDVLLSEMTGQDIAIIQAGAGAGTEYFEGLVSV